MRMRVSERQRYLGLRPYSVEINSFLNYWCRKDKFCKFLARSAESRNPLPAGRDCLIEDSTQLEATPPKITAKKSERHEEYKT